MKRQVYSAHVHRTPQWQIRRIAALEKLNRL